MFVPSTTTPPAATRGQNYSFTISFTENTGGSITGVVATHSAIPDDTANITNSTTSFTSEGKYLAGWPDVFTYCSAGKSDLEETPQTAVGIHNMPPDKNLFKLDQAVGPDVITKSYSVTVNYIELQGSPPTIPVPLTGQITIQHQCNNDYQAIKQYLNNYDYNDQI
ncbi:MAG: hypothetical protein CMA64_06185 [Euryarchaeota archaeon]|nr:hypothetical protein [Euryarchaeota archaeon]